MSPSYFSKIELSPHISNSAFPSIFEVDCTTLKSQSKGHHKNCYHVEGSFKTDVTKTAFKPLKVKTNSPIGQKLGQKRRHLLVLVFDGVDGYTEP